MTLPKSDSGQNCCSSARLPLLCLCLCGNRCWSCNLHLHQVSASLPPNVQMCHSSNMSLRPHSQGEGLSTVDVFPLPVLLPFLRGSTSMLSGSLAFCGFSPEAPKLCLEQHHCNNAFRGAALLADVPRCMLVLRWDGATFIITVYLTESARDS